MTGEQIICGLYVGVSVLLFVLGIPLWRKLVPPNWWYGFRTPTTVRNAYIWYPVNRVTGLWMMAVGPVTALTALVVYRAGLPIDAAAWVNLAALSIGIVGMLVHGGIVLRRVQKTGS
jgi:uncharacterized membrane protein